MQTRQVLAAFGFLLCLAAAAPASSETMKIAIGYVPNADFVPLFVAQDKGFFAKQGIEVALTPIPIPSNIPPAITSGSIEMGPSTAPILLLTNENGLDLVTVAGWTRNLASNPLTSLMVRKGVSFTGPADLKGKRVGMPGLMSAFDLHFRMWLRKNNIPIDQVTLVDISFPPMADMLRSGTIDAAVAIEPFRTAILKSGAGDRAADFLGEVSKDDAGLMWVAKGEWAKTHVKERAAFFAGLEEGVADVLQDRKGAEAVELKYLKFAAPVLDDYELAITPADLQFYQDMMVEIGFLKDKTDVAKLIVQ
jgi:NitT/TauT family transport system substrate-binding protein